MGSQQQKMCFVISPIGEEGSAVRKHADDVFYCIIEPACRARDGQPEYIVERGDHKAAPGKITDQIYEDILAADLIIAVLTNENPNVYYELAIAQAAAKPVILLLEKGFSAPFDVKDQRIIYYDFDPRAIIGHRYANMLKEAITALEERRSAPVVSFAPYLTPLGNPMQTIGARASESEPSVISMVEQAEQYSGSWACH